MKCDEQVYMVLDAAQSEYLATQSRRLRHEGAVYNVFALWIEEGAAIPGAPYQMDEDAVPCVRVPNMTRSPIACTGAPAEGRSRQTRALCCLLRGVCQAWPFTPNGPRAGAAMMIASSVTCFGRWSPRSVATPARSRAWSPRSIATPARSRAWPAPFLGSARTYPSNPTHAEATSGANVSPMAAIAITARIDGGKRAASVTSARVP